MARSHTRAGGVFLVGYQPSTVRMRPGGTKRSRPCPTCEARPWHPCQSYKSSTTRDSNGQTYTWGRWQTLTSHHKER